MTTFTPPSLPFNNLRTLTLSFVAAPPPFHNDVVQSIHRSACTRHG